MYKISFFCEGKPQGKERPRTVRKNGKVWSYTPKKTKEYEEKVRLAFLDNPDFFRCPFVTKEYFGEITANITAYFEMPKSWPESRKFLHDGKSFLKKPDSDNIGKSILDSLNGVAYQDDSQVSRLHVSKKYGRTAGIEVEILYWNEKA